MVHSACVDTDAIIVVGCDARVTPSLSKLVGFGVQNRFQCLSHRPVESFHEMLGRHDLVYLDYLLAPRRCTIILVDDDPASGAMTWASHR